jgi:hypothetical protein
MLGRGIVVTSLTALALVAPGTQAAETPAPGCAGSWADAAGDWSTSAQTEAANLDITEFWFDTRNGQTTANLRVADLSATPPEGADAARWRVQWQVGEQEFYVQASSTGGTPTYTWGDTSRGITERGNVAGGFYPGPRGVIQWTVPAEAKAGLLQAPIAQAEHMRTQASMNFIAVTDTASGTDHTITECAAGAPVPPPTPAPNPAPAPTTPGSTIAPVPAAAALDVRAPKTARLPRRGRRTLTLKLSSDRGVRAVGATLFKGTRRVATGILPRLGRTGSLRLGQTTTKRLKAGRYTLVLSGFNADGVEAARQFSLRLR